MPRHRSRLLPILAIVLAGCTGRVADHEALGDRAYVDHDYSTALIEYRLALTQENATPDLRAKAGAAALRSRDLVAAAMQYQELAAADPDRTSEAADGLEKVAVAAMEDGNREGLEAALQGLVAAAEGRALGRFAQQVAAGFGQATRPEDVLAVLPYAAAAATDSRTEDSLIFEYAVTLVRQGDCETAVPVFEGLLRRRRSPGIVDDASGASSTCALSLGRRELRAGHPNEAEQWFRRAVVGGGNSQHSLMAYIGLGDVMFAQGDFFGAAEAYWRARFGASRGDSIYQVAEERLNNIGNAGTDEDGKVF